MHFVYLDIAKIAFDSHPKQEMPKKKTRLLCKSSSPIKLIIQFDTGVDLCWVQECIIKGATFHLMVNNLWSYNSFLMQDLASEKFLAWNIGWGSQAGTGSE